MSRRSPATACPATAVAGAKTDLRNLRLLFMHELTLPNAGFDSVIAERSAQRGRFRRIRWDFSCSTNYYLLLYDII